VRAVEVTPEALADLEEIANYIAAVRPRAAKAVCARVVATFEKLAFMPAAREGRIAETYERPVRGLPYIIAFDLPASNTLRILRIIHGARDWRPDAWPE